MWARKKWAQKLKREGKGKGRHKKTRLKGLGKQQMRRKIEEEWKRWN